MEMDKVILDLLKSVDEKVERISHDVSEMKIKDMEQWHKLNALEEKFGIFAERAAAIETRLKKIEDDFIEKKDINILFDKVRKLEDAPHKKIIGKIDFVKKTLLAGLAVLITGAIVSVGTVIWKLVINLDTIIEAIENLRQGGGV